MAYNVTGSDFPIKDVRVKQSFESSLTANILNRVVLEINPCHIQGKNMYRVLVDIYVMIFYAPLLLPFRNISPFILMSWLL